MKKKLKKLILAGLLLSGLMVACTGAACVTMLFVTPGLLDWTKQNALALVALHPDAAELMGTLTLDPGLGAALQQLGATTLDPQELMAQLTAAAVPVAALEGLSPTQINSQLSAWGLPLRVAETPAQSAPAADAPVAGEAEAEAEEP